MTETGQAIGLGHNDIRLLLDILNNLSIKGKDTAIQIVRIIMALEQALPQEEDSTQEEQIHSYTRSQP